MKLIPIDLFSRVGGLTEILHKAGFQTELAFEIDKLASKVYKLNHKKTKVIIDAIRNISTENVKKELGNKTIQLLAPHASDSNDIDDSVKKVKISKQSFWLNKRLIQKVVLNFNSKEF